MVTLLDAT
ncbi:hypothetical protein LINPERPRIM_LOCUS15970 [Linum perenne]